MTVCGLAQRASGFPGPGPRSGRACSHSSGGLLSARPGGSPDQDPPGHGLGSWRSSSGETVVSPGDISSQEQRWASVWKASNTRVQTQSLGAGRDPRGLLALPDMCPCPGQGGLGVRHRGDTMSLQYPGLDKGWHQRDKGQLGPLGPTGGEQRF